MCENIICKNCQGRGFVKPKQFIQSGIQSSLCNLCGFQALGQTQVRQFQKRGNLCRDCSGDYS